MKRQLARPTCRWEDNTKINLEETGFEDVVLIHLAQDRNHWWAFVNTVMNLHIP
jgi:hypothetical protein